MNDLVLIWTRRKKRAKFFLQLALDIKRTKADGSALESIIWGTFTYEKPCLKAVCVEDTENWRGLIELCMHAYKLNITTS